MAGGWTGALKLFNYAQRSRTSFGNLCLKNANDRPYSFPRWSTDLRNAYANDPTIEKKFTNTGTANPNPKKKKVFVPRVTLLTDNDDMSVVTLEMAQRIADRRSLKLVKILDFDAKTERPIYKLMTTKDWLQEDMARRKSKKIERETSLKSEKLLAVSSKISDHDLDIKIKSTIKFLTKKHEVRFVVNFDGNPQKSEAICTRLEAALNDVPVTMKKTKTHDRMKFHLTPKLTEMLQTDSESKATEPEKESPPAEASTIER